MPQKLEPVIIDDAEPYADTAQDPNEPGMEVEYTEDPTIELGTLYTLNLPSFEDGAKAGEQDKFGVVIGDTLLYVNVRNLAVDFDRAAYTVTADLLRGTRLIAGINTLVITEAETDTLEIDGAE